MDNRELGRALREFAIFFEMDGVLGRPVEGIDAEGGCEALQQIPSIGQGIACMGRRPRRPRRGRGRTIRGFSPADRRPGSALLLRRETEVNPLFVDFAERPHIHQAIDRVLQCGTLTGMEAADKMKAPFKTALEIPIAQHMQIQHAFQRFIDNSASKTIDVPADITRVIIEARIGRAWNLGLKGLKLFRFGSRATQVIEPGPAILRTDTNNERCVIPTRCALI